MTKVNAVFSGNTLLDRVMYWIGRNILVGFSRVFNRLTVEGRENVPTSGAFILSPVHRSNVDTPIAAVCTKRRMRYMGKDSLWTNRFFGRVLSAVGGFPVSRDIADREALLRCAEVLAAGEPLVLFPEGERKSGPLVQPLKDGAAYLALKANVPIVPVGIGGSEGMMRKGSKFIKPVKIHVVIGTPIMPTASESGRVSKSQRVEMSTRLHQELQRLFDEAQRKARAS